MRRSPAPSNSPGTFFAAQFSAGYTTNISGFDLRQTHLINSWFLVGSVSSLLTTLYGQILLAKVAFFAAMLALAAANRFWLVPRMIETRMGVSGEPACGSL
jgi:putative copper export protein